MRTATVVAMAALLALTGCSSGSSSPESSTGPATPAQTGQPVGAPNGVEKLSPEEVLKKARQAAQQARSVHVVATSDTATLDMEMTQNASDGSRSSGEKSIETRVVDNTLYLKADPAYWKQAFPTKNVGRIDGRWVAANLKDPKLKAWRVTTTLDPLMKTFLTDQGATSVGEVGVRQGQPAVPVTSAVGQVWVATTGKPYVLTIDNSPGDATSVAQFTDWDADVTIEAPPPGQTMDIMELR